MKSRKLIGAIAAIVMSATFAAGLAACGGGSDEHSHSWQYKDIGGGYHREECSCGEYKESEEHHDVDGNDECDECHADLTTVVAVNSVTLDQTSATITVGGETLTLTATVNPVGAATVLWESSDVTVATVSGGVVTAIKAGTATITAKAGGKSATCELVVNDAPPTETVEMDEEKWTAAFTFGDRIAATQVRTTVDGKETMTLKLDGKKVFMGMNREGYTYESYMEETEEGKVYVYSKGYEYWTKTESEQGMNTAAVKEMYLSVELTFPFDNFKAGTVNGEYVAKGAYVGNFLEEGDIVSKNVKSATLHFDGNGKIISGEYVVEEEDGDEHYYVTFDYNPTVTLPVALMGGEVTEAEWNAALQMKYSNYRVGVSMYNMVVNEYQCDGNKKMTSYGQFGSDGITYDQTFYSKESGGIYAYKTDHGRTTKTKTSLTDEQYAAMTAIQFFGINTAQYVKSNFEFDEESGMYSAVLDGGINVSVKFKDGKLVWARQIDESNYEDYTIDFVYGDTNITIPAVNTVGGQVTSDEWTAALAMSDAKMQMEIDVTYGSYKVGEMVGVKDGDKLYQVQKSNGKVIEMYAVKDGDNYYGYYVMDGVWAKEEIEGNEYIQYLPSSMFTGLNKDDFTWNENTQSYIKAASGGVREIRFVNKKVDYVVIDSGFTTQKVYFSYGAGMVTVPTVGDKADSDDYPGSGGGGQGGEIVKPSIDIDEKEWGALFEDVYACPEFNVYVRSSDGEYQYTFVDNDSIAITDINLKDTTTYKIVDGSLKKIIVTAAFEPDEQESEFETLAEAKNELIGRFFEIEGMGNIVKLYSQFSGNGGQYQCSEGSRYIAVLLQDGKLKAIAYGDDEDGTNHMVQFDYPTSEGPQESEKN